MENTSHIQIPIAELSPTIQEPAPRSIKAIVTLTWPYSSATGSVAFLLAEPDFRLRRTRGQVRVQFAGASAKYVAKSHIASGDEVVLCLDGVEWIYDTANVATPGRGIEYQLKFTEKLLLQFRAEGSELVESIDIDHPAPEQEPERESPAEEISVDIAPIFTPPPPVPKTNGVSTRADPEADNYGIFSSPAFVKRARTSYGSLFELDPFAEEDGAVPGKGRKRTRLSSTWKYTSRSPSPEMEQSEEADAFSVLANGTMKQGPIMTDEGCQTIELEDSNAVEDLVSFSQQAINIGSTTYMETDIPIPKAHSPTPIPPGTEPPTVLEYILHQESNGRLNGEQEANVSPRPQDVPSQTISFSGGFTAPAEGDAPDPSVNLDGHRKIDRGDETESPLPVDSHVDLYAASPRDPRDERKLGAFGDLHIPAADISGLDTSILDPVDQFVPGAIYDGLPDTTSRLQHLASPGIIGDHPNQMTEAREFYTEDSHDKRYSVHGSSPSSHSLTSTTQLYPDIDHLVQQNPVHTWGAPLNPASFPYLEDAHDRMGNRSSAVPRTPGSVAMSRSQSSQSQVVDLTEGSDEEDEEDAEDQSKEDDYSEGANDAEDYTQAQDQMSFEESIVMDEEQYEASIIDEEGHVPGAVRNHYLQQATRNAEVYSQGSQEEQDGHYEDEYEKDESGKQYLRAPSNPSDDDGDEEPESGEDYYDEEDGDEEIYEEEMDGYGTPSMASAPREPVVIDLLSSDDEATEEPPTPKAPIALSSQRSQHPPAAEATDESESSLDENIQEPEDVSSSDEKSPEPAGSKLEVDSPQGFQFQAQVTGEAEGKDSDMEMQDNQYASSPDPLQADFASEGFPEQDLQPSNHTSRNEESNAKMDVEVTRDEDVNATMDVEVTGDPHAVSDAAPPIREGEHTRGARAIEPELNYGLMGVVPENKNGEEEYTELENPEVANTTKIDGDIKETNGPPSESLRNKPIEAKHSRSLSPLGLDGANDSPVARATHPKLHRNDPSSPPSSTLNVLPQPYNGGFQLPTPDATQVSGVMISTETSFAGGLDSQSSITPTQNTLITQASSVADEPVSDTKTEETKAGTEDFEPSKSLDVDQHEHELTANVVKTPTKRLRRKKSSEVNEEQTTAVEVAEAVEVATEEETRNIVSENGTKEKLNGEIEDSKKIIESQSKAKAPAVTPLRRSHRRIKSTSSSVDPGGEEQQTEVQETAVVTPRRSHRHIKSTTPSADGNEIRLETPAGSGEKNGIQADFPLQMAVDEPSTPKGYDASFELALSSFDSPSKAHNLRTPPSADLKVRLSRALRTELGEFTALKVLRFHLNHKLDVLAIATTTPPEPHRSKGGPRHYQITFNVTDPTIAPSGVAEIQIFRPYKEALPAVQAGNGVLLRNFQVFSAKNRGFGLRSDQNEASSWVVFKDGEEAEVRGPPVEYGTAEKNHIASLKTWYGTLDTVAVAKLDRANAEKGTSPGKPTRKKG